MPILEFELEQYFLEDEISLKRTNVYCTKKGVRNIIKLLHPGQTRAPGAKRGAHTTDRKACYLTSPGLKPASCLTA